jgi:hypothetical protein
MDNHRKQQSVGIGYEVSFATIYLFIAVKTSAFAAIRITFNTLAVIIPTLGDVFFTNFLLILARIFSRISSKTLLRVHY